MKPSQFVEVITDAVTDAVREALPKLIAAHLEERLAATLTPAIERLDHIERRVHERLTEAQGNFTRGFELCETRTKETEARTHERLTEMQADFAARAIAQADTLAASWKAQADALQATLAEKLGAAVAALVLPVGPEGKAGPTGRDGRDATFTAPVHYKAGTAYQRGALVAHRGGLWHANVDTDTEPGEACSGFGLVLDGREPQCIETVDGTGELALVYRYASGVVRLIPLGFRPMQHAGIYDHGRAYLANDVVTCDGSLWLARAGSASVKPGTDEGRDAWRLIVKRGKDGRDGATGERGERGERGEAAPLPAPRGGKPKPNGAPT